MSEIYFSRRTKIILMGLLILLNIILRFQVVQNEIGWDSFSMHIMTNSLTEYGYARWWLHPLSVFGLYPASYTSTMHFLLSGIEQTTGLEMRWVIFLYCVFFGLVSMFTAYLMAGEIIDDDLFKFLVAFGFSTSPAVVGYTTWTIAARNLLVVLAPLLVYLLLKCRMSIRYVPLTVLFAIFLFTTHHLFYFLIPAFFSVAILALAVKLRKLSLIKDLSFKKKALPKKYYTFTLCSIKRLSSGVALPLLLSRSRPVAFLNSLIAIFGFLAMYSIPFFTGRFIENSRYASIDMSYVRYTGLLIIPAIGGLFYMIFKHKKAFGEWFLLLTLILLTTFIYEQTYMKWFLPIFLVPFAGIGLLNVIKLTKNRRLGRLALPLAALFMVLVICFTGYYQFIHFMSMPGTGKTTINERYIEDSTYNTGRWMKTHIANGNAISNDALFGKRIFAASETVHMLTGSTVADQIYGFVKVNISEFKRYPLTEDSFWFDGYSGPDIGEIAWESVHRWLKSDEFTISYVVENKKCSGRICWHHGNYPQFIRYTYEKNCIYDCGNIGIWKI